MKTLLLKYLKYALIGMAFLFVILLAFALVLLLNWPWWMGFFLVLFLLALGVLFLLLRKIWLKRREERFVQQVIEQDESNLKALSGKEKDDLKELQLRWKEAVEALRRSHLRKYGNPLYVLPWYMVLGESGSGKTTAITSARLSSPFAEVSRTSGLSGTKNVDWWFFEQAIILDTAGRYAIPIDEGRDKEEWQKFLSLLVRYRRKEPLHGLIIAVAADRLLEGRAEALEEDGKQIRRRIDELMRVLGAKFPVYVLVTKCDLVQGMTQFCEQLPEKSLDQPMGYINQDLQTDVVTVLEKAFQSIGERLRNLRLLMLHQPGPRGVDPSLLLFPEEFENLKKGLHAFMTGAFKENPYQETPILRGLFFSSGRQEGSPYSHFLSALGLIGEKEVLPGTNKGLFLHDLFAKVFPKDRGLFAPTKRALQWRMLTRNLGLTAWVLLVIALCGLLSFSFVKNLKVINDARNEFAKPLVLKGEVLSDLATMDRFCQSILKVEEQNRGWWVPRFGLTESKKVELGLKEKYCRQFQMGFLTSFDKQMAQALAGLTLTTPDETVAHYVTHLVRRINLLKARLEGQPFSVLMGKPQPSYEPTSPSADLKATSEMKTRFGQLYLYYLIWRTDIGEINKEIAVLQAWLKDLLATKRTNLRWLVLWADRQGTIPSIGLRDFWGGSLSVAEERSVAPSFTRKGKEAIDAFIKELESALPEPALLSNQKADFERWYPTVCFEHWQHFLTVFPRGAERLKGMKEWQPVASKMGTDQGPYFALLNRIATELEPHLQGESLPLWLQQVYHFQVIKALSRTQKEGGLIDKAAEEARKWFTQLEKRLGKEVGQLEAQSQAAKAFLDYTQGLNTIAQATASRSQAYQLASQVFSEDPASSKSPLVGCANALNRLKGLMAKGRPTEEVFWRLVGGPLDFLWSFIRRETAAYLQAQWEEKVLAEVQGLPPAQATQLLLGPEGHVWKFMKGTAAPFVSKTPKGYVPKEFLGGAIPFEPSFLNFVTKGAPAPTLTKQSYSVVIRGLPTAANPEAKTKPHSTKIELNCAGQTQTLVNYNFPVSRTFQWSMETCGDVLFQIEVGPFVLTKRFTGNQAFPDFLQEFREGQRVFTPSDFPNEKAGLEGLGIKQIKVSYQFGGDFQALVGQIKPILSQAPASIVRAWEE
ncbi:MAG: type VI secretion system protein ImpL [Desulfobacterota bacterium]|nr:type VI secretion system protein ImpL [Thermodesulfobacteriota bacterium]